MAINRRIVDLVTAGLSGGFTLAAGGVLKALEHFGVVLPPGAWLVYGIISLILMLICGGALLHIAWTWTRARGLQLGPAILISIGLAFLLPGMVWAIWSWKPPAATVPKPPEVFVTNTVKPPAPVSVGPSKPAAGTAPVMLSSAPTKLFHGGSNNFEVSSNPPTVAEPSQIHEGRRAVDAEELGRINLSPQMTAAIWDDGTVDAGEVASQLRAGLLAAGWKLAGGGQKMADAASFPYPLTIEVSSVRASEEDNSPDAAKALHAALERQHIASTIRLTEQPLPPNFLKIEVKGQ